MRLEPRRNPAAPGAHHLIVACRLGEVWRFTSSDPYLTRRFVVGLEARGWAVVVLKSPPEHV